MEAARLAVAEAEPMTWSKTDIIHFLAGVRGYRRYLEIATATTGNKFGEIDQSRFTTCHRLMYRCPSSFDDGQKINFRTSGPDTAEWIATIKSLRLTYDIILVDSYHEYASSYRDIKDAFGLIAPGGAVVVHDCLPPLGNENIITPTPVIEAWCGVTFMAYVDFVTQTAGLDYTTVEADFGCGIVQKSTQAHGPDAPAAALQSWMTLGEDPNAALRFVHDNKDVLLHAVSVEDFVSKQAGMTD
jgi:Methyltransferase domain